MTMTDPCGFAHHILFNALLPAHLFVPPTNPTRRSHSYPHIQLHIHTLCLVPAKTRSQPKPPFVAGQVCLQKPDPRGATADRKPFSQHPASPPVPENGLLGKRFKSSDKMTGLHLGLRAAAVDKRAINAETKPLVCFPRGLLVRRALGKWLGVTRAALRGP